MSTSDHRDEGAGAGGTGRTGEARPARLYAIGDVHGRLDLLERVLDELRADASRARAKGSRTIAVFLGDYVDRGPDSRGVLDRLCRLARGGEDGIIWRFLEGNHEAAMRAFLTVPERNAGWLDFGGDAALASFGVPVPALEERSAPALRAAADALEAALTDDHRRFLDQLDSYYEHGATVFVHAGVRPGVDLALQSRRDLLTIREPFLSTEALPGRLVVHGHTVVTEPEVGKGRIAIDTGACGSGVLTCLVIDGHGISCFSTRGDGLIAWRDLPCDQPGASAGLLSPL